MNIMDIMLPSLNIYMKKVCSRLWERVLCALCVNNCIFCEYRTICADIKHTHIKIYLSPLRFINKYRTTTQASTYKNSYMTRERRETVYIYIACVLSHIYMNRAKLYYIHAYSLCVECVMNICLWWYTVQGLYNSSKASHVWTTIYRDRAPSCV